MIAAESLLVDGMVRGLEVLLDRARTWKNGLQLEPALPAYEFSGMKGLPNTLPPEKSQLHAPLVEAAARLKFHHLTASVSIHDPGFTEVWNLFDILNICADQGQCDPPLVWLLLEELLDIESIDGCRIAFDYLESRQERLIAKDFKTKNLIILRSCNELLRRLSRAEDTVFCGRVYIFLFQSFPLGDKSSVNLRGDFHTENVTNFEYKPRPQYSEAEELVSNNEHVPNNESMIIKISDEEKTTQLKQDSDQMSLDDLYPVFWTLQKAFSNPTTLFSPPYLAELKKGLGESLAMFKRVPRVIQAKSSDEKRGLKRTANEAFDDFTNNYSPKYLTSRELFGLELSDLAFQRHILVQALILLDFLHSLTESSRLRLAHLNTQKALQYSMTLSEEDAQWVHSTRTAIATYLQDGPEGKFYYRMVDTVLSRDKNWVRWKMESCHPIAKAPVTGIESSKSSMDVRQASKSRPIRSAPMGALEVGFLLRSNNLDSAEEHGRPIKSVTTSVETLLKAIEGDSLDLDMANEDEERANLLSSQQNKSWRLLRVTAKQKLRRFKDVKDVASYQKFLGEPLKQEEVEEIKGSVELDSTEPAPVGEQPS